MDLGKPAKDAAKESVAENSAEAPLRMRPGAKAEIPDGLPPTDVASPAEGRARNRSSFSGPRRASISADL